MARHRRTLEGGDPEQGYDFLYATLCREVARRQQAPNQVAMERALIGGPRHAAAASSSGGPNADSQNSKKKSKKTACRFFRKGT